MIVNVPVSESTIVSEKLVNEFGCIDQVILPVAVDVRTKTNKQHDQRKLFLC